jgi:hypothetical protein
MVNIYNRRPHFAPVKEASRVGPLIEPPLNQLAMPTDYTDRQNPTTVDVPPRRMFCRLNSSFLSE